MSGLFKGSEQDTSEAVATVAEDEKSAKKIRTALYATEGEASGDELLSGEVKRRETLFGN